MNDYGKSMMGETDTSGPAQSRETSGVFGVIVEYQNQGPILMECEGPRSSYGAALDYMRRLVSGGRVLRACVVRLEYEDGNELLILDMKRMQK